MSVSPIGAALSDPLQLLVSENMLDIGDGSEKLRA